MICSLSWEPNMSRCGVKEAINVGLRRKVEEGNTKRIRDKGTQIHDYCGRS